jgi:hypothetical protein
MARFMTYLLSTLAFLMILFVCAPASATLIDRGGGIIYDDQLSVSWLQDGDQAPSPAPSITRWARYNAWAQDLVVRGYDDWRLASMDLNADGMVVDCAFVSETACRDNEYGHLFYYGLGGSSGQDKTGDQIAPGGALLTNIQAFYGWNGPPTPDWNLFDFRRGGLNAGVAPYRAWAVRGGDSVQVPEPSSLVLSIIGLLFGSRIRRRLVSLGWYEDLISSCR